MENSLHIYVCMYNSLKNMYNSLKNDYGAWKVLRSAVGKLETQNADGIIQVQVQMLENRRLSGVTSSLNHRQQAERVNSPTFSLFVFWPLKDQMRPTHFRKGQSTLYSLQIELCISSRSIPIDTFRITFNQIFGHSVAQLN